MVGLTAALGGDCKPVKVLRRNQARFMSTFPNEVVTCLMPNGRRRRLFIKYQGTHGHNCFDHRGDVAYEAEVYARLLGTLPAFRPKCFGVYQDCQSGETWLILEYVYQSVRVSDLNPHHAEAQPRTMAQTARWLAQFHVAFEGNINSTGLSFLKRYDAEYYRGWASRTFEFAQPFYSRFPWLKPLSECGDAWFAPLLGVPPTVIHGEFYFKNVLVRGQEIFPVDWESAAIAPGEIDLAALTDGKRWAEEAVRKCQRQYVQERWPQNPPAAFKVTLEAARMYLHFRWLGERPEWTCFRQGLGAALESLIDTNVIHFEPCREFCL